MDTWSINSQLELKAAELSFEEKQKFLEIPYYLHLWTQPFGGLAGKKVLDFGCGGGTSAAGIALLHGAKVHGTDINSEAEQCSSFIHNNFGISKIDDLTFQEIEPGGQWQWVCRLRRDGSSNAWVSALAGSGEGADRGGEFSARRAGDRRREARRIPERSATPQT